MSSLSCKNVKIQDTNGNVASTITWDGNNVTFDKPVLVPTVAAGTNNTQVATTAFAYGTLSANTNGYQILPSGLIIQWGTQASTNNVTFPIAFPNVCGYVNWVYEVSGIGNIVRIKNLSKTGFTPNYDACCGSGSDAYTMTWFAIGY
jgi:hypothetical protein